MNKFDQNQNNSSLLGDLHTDSSGSVSRPPWRTLLIRGGITLAFAGGCYLMAGLLGIVPMTLETLGWNNIRIVSGIAIFGCLMAAVGYGDE